MCVWKTPYQSISGYFYVVKLWVTVIFNLVYPYFLICCFIMNMHLVIFIKRVTAQNCKNWRRLWKALSTISSSQSVLHKCKFSLLTLPSYTYLPFWLETLAPRPQIGKKVWWYRILFTSCTALDKSLDLSESQLPCLQNGEKNKGSFQGLYAIQDGKLPGLQ